MKILTADIGTGTQDIFLYDSRLDIENGFKLILPSPTMRIFRKITKATQDHCPILLSGDTMEHLPAKNPKICISIQQTECVISGIQARI